MLNKISIFIKRFYLLIIFIFLYTPIVTLMVFSFNDSKSMGQWKGFTLRWYQELMQNDRILLALKTTLLIAVIASVVATIIGTFAAIGIHKMRGFKKKALLNINYLPVLNPDIVTAIGFMLLFTSLKVETGFTTMVLAHIAFCIPYVILSIMPKLRSLDPNIAEAALDLGCTPLQALYKVILPQIKTSIISGALVAFTMSFDDFVISLFTTGPGVNNISIYVYSNVKRINPTINALSALIVFVITIVLIIINVVPMIKNRRRKDNEEMVKNI